MSPKKLNRGFAPAQFNIMHEVFKINSPKKSLFVTKNANNHSHQTKKSSIIWIVCAMVAFICTGFIGVMQKIHQTSIYKDELDIFLIIAFVISFVYSCVSYMIIRNKQKKSQETYGKDFGVVLLVIMVISGICVAVNNKVNLDLSGKIPSVIFFPVVNGGGLILSTLASVIIFREKLSCKKWAGIFVGLLAVVLLCNPFK